MNRKNLFALAALMLMLLPLAPLRAEVVSIDNARETAVQYLNRQAAQSQSAQGQATQGQATKGQIAQGQIAQGHAAQSQATQLRTAAVRQNQNQNQLQLQSDEPIVLSKDGQPALYIFNMEQGGFVIVSAESDTRRQVLARTESGRFDPANVSGPFKDVIDGYMDGIGRLRRATPAQRAQMQKALSAPATTEAIQTASGQYQAAQMQKTVSRAKSLPDSVAPLLDSIKWGQGAPFNLMCPTYESEGSTYHYVAGCVATAVAQVMMYHRWPAQGRGSDSYMWYEGNKTLSADFSQSTYLWDQMLPSYNNGYTETQADAVALLIRDVGVAMHMEYTSTGSGAAFRATSMVDYFDYDKNIRYLDSKYCSTDDWEGELRQELADGRPVLCSGGSSHGGHEFVCDGYNADGLFHYNFGWNGLSNGWYASTATGYDSSPSIAYGVQKNQGGKGALTCISTDDFKWVSDNTLSCVISAYCYGLSSIDEDLTLEIGVALHNLSTDEITCYPITQSQTIVLGLSEFTFNQEVADGSYEVYPVARISGQDWQEFFHHPLHQLVVDLTVSGGVKTWANNHLADPIDEGVTEIDGIYYILDGASGQAAVTRRNSKGNSYSGDVVIPDQVTYNDTTYDVTAINGSAFGYCDQVESVRVGRNVERIEMGAFSICSVKSISFADSSQLNFLGGWAFNGCGSLTDCRLPEGLASIGMCAFQSCWNLKSVSIPSTVNYIAKSAFNGMDAFRAVGVSWTSLNGLYCDLEAFNLDDLSAISLYVPEGYSDIYRSTEPWSGFTIVEGALPDSFPDPEPEPDPSQESYVYVLGCDGVWNPSKASDTLFWNAEDQVFQGTVVVADVEGGYGYFALGTQLGKSSSDWSTFNLWRLSAPEENYLLQSGETCNYWPYEYSFKALAGLHLLTVDTTACTVSMDLSDGLSAPVAAPFGNDAAVYDLYGRRVYRLEPGCLYLQRGRKFVAK